MVEMNMNLLKGSKLPMYMHDCDYCVFLGSWFGYDDTDYDLYFCDGGSLNDDLTVIARFGDIGHQYRAGLTFVGSYTYPLTVAFQRALDSGFFVRHSSREEFIRAYHNYTAGCEL